MFSENIQEINQEIDELVKKRNVLNREIDRLQRRKQEAVSKEYPKYICDTNRMSPLDRPIARFGVIF